jgi:hypothetical protein
MKTIKVKDLMSISGKSGLFRFLAQARNGVVVESLVDKKRTVAPPSARVSALEDISIFSQEEDVPLADVLMKIHVKENGGPSIDPKSGNEELKAYFTEVFPEYDADRVYISDIKKVITWYNLLHELDLLEVIEKEEENSEDGPESDELNEGAADKKKEKSEDGPEKKADDKDQSKK